MITIQYGPWLPDIANIGFQIQDQEGPVQVPVADCLNVIYVNGVYQAINSPLTIGGPVNAQVTGAITYINPAGLPVPVVGALNNNAYYYTGSWIELMTTGFADTLDWNFAQYNQQVFVQAIPASTAELASGNLYAVVPGGSTTPSPIPGASYGAVLGVVGQFVMIGDLMGPSVSGNIGTGNGTQTTFSGTLAATAPIYPGSVKITTTLTGIGAITVIDNGAGVISGIGVLVGSVNYDIGAVIITFTQAVSNTVAVNTSSCTSFRARLQWSPVGNPSTTWPTPLTNASLAVQSGINDLQYQFGPIMFVAGYELYGVVFQRNAITRAQYIGGNVVFSWQTFSYNLGLLAKGAAVKVGQDTYFLSDQGFFYTDGAGVYPIGTADDNSAGIDGWFFANVNKNALTAISAGYDARLRNVVFAIPTGSNTLPDTLLAYNFTAKRWTRSALATELVWIDSDGSTDRLGAFNQTHHYELLTGSPSGSIYLESVDLMFSDGLVRDTNGVRPNGSMTTPMVTVGVRSTLTQSITYSAGFAPDAFGAGFAPALTEGLYTRIRVACGAATSIQGATCDMIPGGPL